MDGGVRQPTMNCMICMVVRFLFRRGGDRGLKMQ